MKSSFGAEWGDGDFSWKLSLFFKASSNLNRTKTVKVEGVLISGNGMVDYFSNAPYLRIG